VDDIQICKVGVTTDPRFIKPTTVAQNTSNLGEAISVPYDPTGGGSLA